MFHHTRLWASALIIGALIIGGFVLSVPRAREVFEGPTAKTVPLSVPSIVIRDSFKKGMHTITGSVQAPNACSTVTAEASVESDHILLALTMPEDTGVCLQVATPIPFSVSIAAPADARIQTTLNGTLATTTGS